MLLRSTVIPLLCCACLSLAGHPLICAASAAEAESEPAPPAVESRASAWLGVGLDKPDDALVYHLELTDDLGVIVVQVAPRSPAETMGLKRYDLITAIDGKPVYTVRAVQQAVQAKQPGDDLRLEVRRGERTQQLDGKLAKRPPMPDRPQDDGQRWPHGLIPPGLVPGHQGRPLKDGQRSGRIQRKDGSSVEWEIEDPDAPAAAPEP